jgi:hypothetical protein
MRPTRQDSVRAALLLFAVLMAWSPARAAEYSQKEGTGELRLQDDNPKAPESVFKVEGGVVEVRLSEKLLLTLSVEGTAPLKIEGGDQVAQVQALLKSGLWLSCEPVGSPKHTTTADGKERWEAAVRLRSSPPKEGIIELRALPVDYTEGGGSEVKRVAWQPIKLRITTDVASVEKKELRPITPPEDLPRPLSWTRWLPWVGIGVAVAGLVAGGWGLRRRFTSPPRPLAPHEWAARELDRIEAMQLPEAGETERFHTLLSDVVRAYLERRFSLPASHQTTAEFLETMRRSPQLTAAQQGLLRDFLGRCDMAKFARAAPPAEECRAVAGMARSFVQETIPRPV